MTIKVILRKRERVGVRRRDSTKIDCGDLCEFEKEPKNDK